MTPERWIAFVVGLVLAGGAAWAARRAFRRYGSPIDVLAVFLVLWSAILLLFAVPVIDYSTTPVVAWVAIYGSIGAVVAASLLADRGGERTDPDRAQETLATTIDPVRLRVIWLACFVLGLAGFAAFVAAIDSVLGWRALLSDPETVREVKRDNASFQDAYGMWKLLMYFNQIAFLLWTVGLRRRAFTDRWRLAVVPGVLSIAPFFFTADRGLLVALVTWVAMLHLLWPAKIAWRRVGVVVAAGIVASAIVVTAVGNRYGGGLDDHPEIAAHVAIPVDPAVIPYMYLTANLPTFGQLTQDALAPRTYGQMSVLPLVKAAHAAGVPGTAPVATGVFYAIPFESFSNYGWLGTFWLDAGLGGAIVLPGMFAAVATLARRRLALRPTFAALWLTSLLLYVVVFSPFANALSTTLTWQYLLLTPVVALTLDPTAAPRFASRLRRVVQRHRWAALGAGGAVVIGLGVGALALRSIARDDARDRSPMRELESAIRKARYTFAQQGRYPQPLALATRLQVNRPDVVFRPQSSYSDPLPGPGVVAVFTTPRDVFLRVRARDGRVFEAHRTEDLGGITFGPGTRDG